MWNQALDYWWLQYVVEAHYTGQEHEVAGAAQQQVVGHKERYVATPPSTFDYDNRGLYMWNLFTMPIMSLCHSSVQWLRQPSCHDLNVCRYILIDLLVIAPEMWGGCNYFLHATRIHMQASDCIQSVSMLSCKCLHCNLNCLCLNAQHTEESTMESQSLSFQKKWNWRCLVPSHSQFQKYSNAAQNLSIGTVR